jgi:hypothetical protein
LQLEPKKVRHSLSVLHLKLPFTLTLFEGEHLRTYFSTFRLQCYLFLLFSPIGLAVAAYLLTTSFEVNSIGHSIGLFFISLLLLIPWTLVPVLFLFTTFGPNTRQRNFSWGYVGLLFVSFFGWVFYF